MTLKTKIARFILIVLAAAAATSAPGIAQETPVATKNTLPAVRTMTAADGRKLEGTILSKDATSIQFRRTTDGKEFMLELSKLSSDDQKFIAELTDARQKYADKKATETHAKGWPTGFQFKTTLVQPQKLAFLALPFDKQEPGGICAAAATLNILQFLDPSLQMGQRELFALFNGEVSGASPTQIVGGIQTLGFDAKSINIPSERTIRERNISEIQGSLDRKLPVMAANSGHAFTLIGYNREEKTLILWDQRMRGKAPKNGLPDGASEITESQFFNRVKTLILISPMSPILGNTDLAKTTGLNGQFKKNQIINGNSLNEKMGAFLKHASQPTIAVALKKNLRVFIQDKIDAVEILQESDGGKWKCKIYPPNKNEDVTSNTINNLLEKSEGVFYTLPTQK